MNRRDFVGGVAAAATLIGAGTAWGKQHKGERHKGERHKIDRVGLQLYTVRGDMKKDFEGTIAKVAQAGYKEVEFAGYFDHTPQQVRAILDKNGLAAPSSHVAYNVLGDQWPGFLEAAKVVGHKYVVCPWIDDAIRAKPEGWKQAADTFNRAAEVAKKAGIQFAYHNHNFEFIKIDGKYAYDILLESTDAALVQMEMDLCWMTIAGQDPLKYFAKYPGRFPLVHVKDVSKVPASADGSPVAIAEVTPTMVAVGSGVIDFKRIFAQSSLAGIQHYFVEDDEPKSPFDEIRASCQYLSKVSF